MKRYSQQCHLGLFPCSGYELDVELGPNITCESGQVCRLLSGGGSNNLVGGPVRSNMRLGSNVWSPFTETKRLWGCDRQALGEDDLTVVGAK